MNNHLIGKTYSQYLKIFDLKEDDLFDKKILDVAGSLSSFCAEANLKEINVIAVDNIYFWDLKKIKDSSKKESQNIDKMALTLFLYDFEQNIDNYKPTNLPKLNFKSDSFDLALIFNLNFDKEMNIKLILESIRVAKEVRINAKDIEILKDERLEKFRIDIKENFVVILNTLTK